MVKIFKGVTAFGFRKLPELRDGRYGVVWCGVLSSPCYYVATASHVSAETIEKYIRGQQTK